MIGPGIVTPSNPTPNDINTEKKTTDLYANIGETAADKKLFPDDMHPLSKTLHEYETLMDSTSHETTAKPEVRIRKLQRVGTACCDYVAKEQDELSLRHGSVVEIIKEECGEKGWVLAKVDNKKGMVPKNYVVLVGSQPSIICSEEVQRTTQLLGSGGFADVYLGYYKGQEVALKISRARSDRDRETLTREALILSRMTHKNIVGFHGLSLNPVFIVLELCQGGTLFTLGRKMSCSDILTVIYWARQVGEAIQHLHSREDPLIYADLKAENVLIKEIPCQCGLEDESWKIVTNYLRNGYCRKCNGLRINLLTLKLADFNVSRSLSVKRDSCAGSLLWMPPEVIKDRNFSKSSDVWSFGMFLWEIFSRKVPFKNCELHTIISAIVYKNETLPLPIDLPLQLRIVFEQCWRKRPEERPPISEILSQLEQAEQNLDNNYKWKLPVENADDRKSESEFETDVLENISRECRDGKSVTIPLYEAVMFMERLGVDQKFGGIIKKLGIALYPPTPANRQKKAKLDKESIGAPCDFRHNVSARLARLRSASPPVDDRSASREKLLVIRYLEDEENSSVKPIHHRSHDSLVDQGKEDGSGGYSTLPRTFRQKIQSQSQNKLEKLTPSQLQQVLIPTQNCCTKLTKMSNFVHKGNGINCLSQSRHDYLTLGPCVCIGSCQHKSTDIIISKTGLSGNRNEKLFGEEFESTSRGAVNDSPNFKERESEYANTSNDGRKLTRTNAVRQKYSNTQQQSQIESNPSSSCSSSLDDFVVVGGCTDLHNPRDQCKKQMNLPDFFNRRVSPPHQQQSPCAQNSSRNSIHEIDRIYGREKRGRKVSNEQMPNSVFYIPPLGEEAINESIGTDHLSDTNRRRSGPFGWVNRIFGTSPRHSTSADNDLDDVVIETARCYHPNHEIGFHLCPLRPEGVLPEISLIRIPELNTANFTIQTTDIAEPLPPRSYKKRADYPEKQRQRQRTESTTSTLPMCVKKVAISPTDRHGGRQRLSVNTIIQMQQPINALEKCQLDSPQQPNPTRSCTDLHNHFAFHNQQPAQSSLLSPDRLESIHQRSRSSESPLFQSSASELVQKLLLQPVPSNGLILNPSYIPMRQKNELQHIFSPSIPPPIPSKTKQKIAPVPLPRSTLHMKSCCDNSGESNWPTSQAPMLNRADLTSKPIQRPNSLGLTPPVPYHLPSSSSPLTTPAITNSFTNSSASGIPLNMTHCDSGIDPEAGTEAENSPYPCESRPPIEHITVFSSIPYSSSKNLNQLSGQSALQNRIVQSGIPKLPTTPPPPPPLPPKRVDGRMPPIPKTMTRVNRF